MRGVPLRAFVLLTFVVTATCTATHENGTQTQSPLQTAAAVRLAVSPPLIAPDGRSRFVATSANEIRAEDAATGAVRWTLPPRLPAGGTTMRWRLLVSDDGASVYVQGVSDERDLTYLGTRRVDARTGVELANDYKYEIYWYQNIVLWTAVKPGGELLMAVERPAAAGGGHWLRTFDPLTLKMRTSVPQSGPPPVPGR
jgi:hypothetical protein